MADLHYLYGHHSVVHLLNKRPQAVRNLWLEPHSLKREEIQNLAQSLGLVCQPGDKSQLTRLAKTDKHQGVVAQATLPSYYNEGWLHELFCEKQDLFVIALDGITDPHNLGAVLRSSAALGVDAVMMPKDKSVGLTPSVYKVACGGVEHVPLVRVTNLARSLHQLRDLGLWVYGASESGTDTLEQVDFPKALVWVFGSEGKGLRRLTEASCDHLVRITTPGDISSLNVSAAMAVCSYEVRRQRILAD